MSIHLSKQKQPLGRSLFMKVRTPGPFTLSLLSKMQVRCCQQVTKFITKSCLAWERLEQKVSGEGPASVTPLGVGACNLESTEGYTCICDTGTSHGFHQIFSDVCELKKVLAHQPQRMSGPQELSQTLRHSGI